MYAKVAYPFMVMFGVIWFVVNLVVITPIYYIAYVQYLLVLHLLLIPAQLLVSITIYTALIRIPIVIPLKYVLELNDSNLEREDNAWLAAQVHLFFVNFIHFGMVSVFLGVCAGTLLGWNIIGIRYLLTWGKKKTKKGTRSLYKSYQGTRVSARNADVPERRQFVTPVSSGKSSLRKDASVQSSPLLSRLLNTVVVDDHNETRATGSNIHMSGNLRGRSTNRSKKDELVYEDDDGYSYSVYTKRSPERPPPQIVSPSKHNKKMSEKSIDSKKTTFAPPIEAEPARLTDSREEEMGTIAEESEAESTNDGATLFSNVRNDATIASSVREEPK